MTETPSVEFIDDKYGRIFAYWEHKPRKESYEWTVFLKAPVHLYDIVDYTPAGKHTTYYGDGRVEEGYHEERLGKNVWTHARNWRLDFERNEPPTKETVVDAIDEELRDCIEKYDGVVHFEKIIGVK